MKLNYEHNFHQNLFYLANCLVWAMDIFREILGIWDILNSISPSKNKLQSGATPLYSWHYRGRNYL